MMSVTKVKLKLLDVLGRPLDDHSVVIDFLSSKNSKHFRATVPLAGQTDVAINLQDCSSEIYRVQLSSTNHRFMQFFLRLTEGDTITRDEPVVFPVNPDRVVNITAPAFGALETVLRDFLNASSLTLNDKPLSGADLYDGLSPILKAALLNFFTKSSHTILGDETSCFDHIHSVVELEQDRMFAKAEPALLEETMQSPEFRPVNFALHREIAPYHLISSFKTRDPHGNLQLTFSRKGDTGGDYLVDMDIDQAGGIEHLFEVAQNSVAGLTNPYNIREILVTEQNLQPLYTFDFAERGVAHIAGPAGSNV